LFAIQSNHKPGAKNIKLELYSMDATVFTFPEVSLSAKRDMPADPKTAAICLTRSNNTRDVGLPLEGVENGKNCRY
jgi:hypothetical protein